MARSRRPDRFLENPLCAKFSPGRNVFLSFIFAVAAKFGVMIGL
jgi:hypothetical protein